MRAIKDRIIIDYTPEKVKELDNGLIALGEDAFDFFTVKALSVGSECKEVKKGDDIYIRKESIFQFDGPDGLVFFTKESLVLKTNGYPIGKKVLLTQVKETVTNSGIIILEEDNAPCKKGAVVALGKDCEELSLGDLVVYNKDFGLKVDTGEVVINEEDVLAILNYGKEK